MGSVAVVGAVVIVDSSAAKTIVAGFKVIGSWIDIVYLTGIPSKLAQIWVFLIFRSIGIIAFSLYLFECLINAIY